jgi:hypothetical protein
LRESRRLQEKAEDNVRKQKTSRCSSSSSEKANVFVQKQSSTGQSREKRPKAEDFVRKPPLQLQWQAQATPLELRALPAVLLDHVTLYSSMAL